MKSYVIGILMLGNLLSCYANNTVCSTNIAGYKVVKNSVYPFYVKNDKSCFFAFYTKNPAPMTGSRGNGNLGDALWYGYYRISNPHKIYEFPKPSDTHWSIVCSLEAISFQVMYGDGKRNVTVIGSCDRYNAINYTFPFVFKWKNDNFVLDKDVYMGLFGAIGLTVEDVRNYIKKPDLYYDILHHRYDPD
ncbi:hypothetical protein [Legionella shakespearei]|uniref:Uncharacterized protein n=1 Tax=Legionella shakespearei DSM 23087 TaxID=1122169 RepID=A0A0W0YSP4_9GAMM|nr:hypothetical protein [Legionella shakespearei]KTD59555.1 hypothetical protein Lsha_1827 [Legionella shakespearei DSM 23087]